MDILDDMGVSK